MNKVVAPSTVFLYKHRHFQTDTNISSWFVFLRSLRTIILHTNHISCYNGTWNLQKIIFVYINDWTESFYLWLLQIMGRWGLLALRLWLSLGLKKPNTAAVTSLSRHQQPSLRPVFLLESSFFLESEFRESEFRESIFRCLVV